MTSLESITVELAKDAHLWWGYTAEHGWVILDRQDARNDGEWRYLVRCRDWSPIQVSRREFGLARFTWFKKHIGALPEDQAQEACRHLLRLQREFAVKAEGLRVTESELKWPTYRSPEPMLDILKGRITVRKLRLFGVACSRRIWHVMTDEDCRQAVRLAERVVEGEAGLEEARRTCQGLEEKYQAMIPRTNNRKAEVRLWCFGAAAKLLCETDLLQVCGSVTEALAHFYRKGLSGSPSQELFKEGEAQADLLREIVGNPFRPVAFKHIWRTLTVQDLAGTVYNEQVFERLPILADALEEAGCDNQELLDHCRSPASHIRGCWALDLVLDKS